MGKQDMYPTHEIDFGLVTEFVEAMDCTNPVVRICRSSRSTVCH